jgi:hypothetical protein
MTTSYISNNTIIATNTGISIAPQNNAAIVAHITNNYVAGSLGISATTAPGMNIQLRHNNVIGGYFGGLVPGPGSLSAVPHFVSSTDFHLTSTSPMIDAGTDENAPLVDIDGVVRPTGGGFDIGAYEFAPLVTPPTANAGPDQTFPAGAAGTASVTLSGVGLAPAGSTLPSLGRSPQAYIC